MKIPGRRQHGSEAIRFRWLGRFRPAAAVSILLAACAPSGCRRHVSPAPVTLSFLHQEGLFGIQEAQAGLQEFTRETGIRVNQGPYLDRLDLYRRLLQEGVGTPDVYGIDVIWPGIESDHLVDLRPYFTSELRPIASAMLANYTDRGRLIAMPYHLNTGVLYYRTDLLRRYGYHGPPRTWDELERMALRIQTGERARGEKNFWGFVWPGGAPEALTCNALEWQVDSGGGQIIEADKKISVNNPRAIRAWERAAHWVGWISPPSVISYGELDAFNVFWVSGTAAFARGWSYWDYQKQTPFLDRAGVASVPGGVSARVAVLGGSGLSASGASPHRAEAIKLVAFLLHKEAQIEADRAASAPRQQPELYPAPTSMILQSYPRLLQPGEPPDGTILLRSSIATGQEYVEVTQAYSQAVHSVLTREVTAPAAAAALEKELARITGSAPERQERKPVGPLPVP
jgi:trehalose/maltose transport system substrate-binding protein